MDIAVTVLSEVGNNCLRGTVTSKPAVLVVEDIAAIPHQVAATVALDGMDAVLDRLRGQLRVTCGRHEKATVSLLRYAERRRVELPDRGAVASLFESPCRC